VAIILRDLGSTFCLLELTLKLKSVAEASQLRIACLNLIKLSGSSQLQSAELLTTFDVLWQHSLSLLIISLFAILIGFAVLTGTEVDELFAQLYLLFEGARL